MVVVRLHESKIAKTFSSILIALQLLNKMVTILAQKLNTFQIYIYI